MLKVLGTDLKDLSDSDMHESIEIPVIAWTSDDRKFPQCARDLSVVLSRSAKFSETNIEPWLGYVHTLSGAQVSD